MATDCNVRAQPTEPTPRLNFLKGVLYIMDSNMEALAESAGITSRHLYYGLARGRTLSQRVRNHIRSVIGEEAWRFVVGETDTLTIKRPGPQAAA